jgi:voltage-gated potassium channel
VYQVVMMTAIAVSLVPLLFKEYYSIFVIIDVMTVVLFIIDYVLRFITADLKLGKKRKSFALYPVTPFAIIDLVTILPGLGIIDGTFKLLRLMRVIRALRVFKALRYSKNFRIITTVIRKQARLLVSLFIFALAYIFISALVMFNVEPDRFSNFFESVWWSVSMLTTVGYGDVFPETTGGKLVSMISSLVGIALIALPSGIITAGFMEALGEGKKEQG